MKNTTIPGTNSWISETSVWNRECQTLELITVPSPSRTVHEMKAAIFNLCRELALRSPKDAEWTIIPGHVSHGGRNRYVLTVMIAAATGSLAELDRISLLFDRLSCDIRRDFFTV